MFDLDYINEVKDRAIALGINNAYLDSSKLLYAYEGQLCLNLDSYLSSLDLAALETDSDGYVIEIPNIFYGVLMSLYHQVYAKRTAYHIIFPADVKYVGEEKGIKANIVQITIPTGYNSYAVCKESLSNSFLDFRACKRLNTLNSRCFFNLHIKKIIFGCGISRVENQAFKECKIDYLEFNNLRTIESYAFMNTELVKADFGNHITTVKDRAFGKEMMLDELRIAGIDQVSVRQFQGVKHLYLPYSVCGDVETIKDELDDVLKMIRYDKPSERMVMDKLKEICLNHNEGNTDKGVFKGIEEKIYDYYFNPHNDVERSEKASSLVFYCMEKLYVYLTTNASLYFYCDNNFISEYDVHDRDYERITTVTLGPDRSLTLYIEEPDY